MPITEILARNARDFGPEISLVEINPELQEKHKITWKEYELVEPNPDVNYRRVMTWNCLLYTSRRV